LSNIPRDFVGYGAKPPKVVWPNGARLALNFAVNYEAGGERSVPAGDGTSEMMGEFPVYGAAPKRDLAMESIFEYETRAGIWRLLRLFEKHRVRLTFFATAQSLQASPEAAREIARQGHEVCSHGYRWVEHFTLSKDEEREHIRKAVQIIKDLTGERPVGWYCREPSENTIELLVEEGGFIYDSDVYNDDLPYYVNVKGKDFLLIPYTPDVNDFYYFTNRYPNSDALFQYLKDSFDTLYEEGKANPKMMNFGIHVRASGRPGRTVAIDRFLNYVKGFPDVWFARRDEIARWWLEHYPPKNQSGE
jgi:peptidoglycan/xylan/chitin deacetylase (PgdA/CDA1 family)